MQQIIDFVSLELSVKYQSEKLFLLDLPNHCWHHVNPFSWASFNALPSSQKSVHIVLLLL